MARYGRDYRGRNGWERERDRHWFGDATGYDVRDGYRDRPRRGYDREYGWESRDRGIPPWEMNRYRSEGPQRDYRGGYGAGYRDRESAYDRDYGYRDQRPRAPSTGRGYRGGPWERPYLDPVDHWYRLTSDPYGPYSSARLFRGTRGGGMSPGRYFTGYGIGSPGGYEPY